MSLSWDPHVLDSPYPEEPKSAGAQPADNRLDNRS